MSKNKILSISIAAYNVEKYIGQTLDTLLNSKELENIEVIIVNDGSKDNTEIISQKYVQAYPDIFRIISKQNGGYGSTINESIKIATGKYFRLLDGDDWVDTNQFDMYVNELKNIDADLIFTSYCEVNENDGTKTQINIKSGKGDLSLDNIVVDDLCMHKMTISTKLYRDSGIHIEEGCFYTDVEYMLYYIPHIEKVYSSECCVYQYRIGMINQSVSINGYKKHYREHIKVIFNIEKYKNENIIKEPIKELLDKRLFIMIYTQYIMLIKIKTEMKNILKDFDDKLKNEDIEMYNQLNKSVIIRFLRKTKFNFIGIAKLYVKLRKIN